MATMAEKREKARKIYKNALIKMKKSDAVKEVAKKMKVSVLTARNYLSKPKTNQQKMNDLRKIVDQCPVGEEPTRKQYQASLKLRDLKKEAESWP